MPAKKKAKKAAGAAAPGTLTIERGGELFEVNEADGLFAVRRRPGGSTGKLVSAEEHSGAFPALQFQAANSTREVEVYRVDAKSRDKAMEILRGQNADAEWCAHVYHLPGDPESLMVPTDTIYVELSPDAQPDDLNELLEEHRLEVTPAGSDEPDGFVLRLTSASTANPIRIANALREKDAIALAETDFAMKIQMHAYRPTDTLFPDQWHLENRGGVGMTAGADVKAPDAWDITRGDRSIRVCVMDDGVDIEHPDFAAPGKVVAAYDFGQNDVDPTPVSSDDNHGTACAGVAVADENGTGCVGSAPGCALMPYRTSGMISDSTIRALFDTARENGADVISCSWGVAAKFFSLSTRMINVIRRAAREGRSGRGCVIVFASGNEASPVDGRKNGQRVRSGFAIHPDVIAVNASTSRDVQSHYSNFGRETWICAPSSGAGGRRVVTTDRRGSAGYQAGDYTTVNGFGGTSSSCPLVAGICALMLSRNPDLTSLEVKEILRDTADKIDPEHGNYDADGHSKMYGYGRVNAFRALEEVQRRIAPRATRRVAWERRPLLAIPDHTPAGITDSVRVDDPGTVVLVEVAVSIRHTWRGDLRLELIAPDGTTAVLHDRTGSSADDLVATYTAETAPGLGGLTGGSALGNWTLRVSDHAAIDTGQLIEWSLVLGLEGGPRTEWTLDPGDRIPDDDPAGIVSEIDVDRGGGLAEIELTVDITHTWRGDLRVALESPSGLTAGVHRGAGGSADDLRQTYRPGDTPALQAMVDAGGDIRGTWKLHVSDHAQRDIGKLNAWGLKLETGD